jgi:hypothetical protein
MLLQYAKMVNFEQTGMMTYMWQCIVEMVSMDDRVIHMICF